MIALRPYQTRAIDAVRAEYSNGVRRVLLVAPTGFGKTSTASELIRRSVAKGKRVLFTVHRREIVMDTARRLRAADVPCTILMAGETFDEAAPVVVASVSSIAAREHHPDADFLIVDEAHHITAQTYVDIAAQYPDARHLGLTATPERGDGVGLRDAFDALVVGATVSELQAEGYLAECDVLAPATKAKGKLAMSPSDAIAKYADGRSAVVFCGSVAESKALAAEIGDTARHIDGTTPAEERDASLAAFASSAVRVLTNHSVLTEGWDSPRAKLCILARSVASPGALIQICGRVLRPFEGQRALVIDLAGNVRELGLPTEDREFTLDGIKRVKKARRPWLSQCDVCGNTVLGTKRGDACSICGTAWPGEATLEVKPAELAAVKPGARKATMDEKSRTWRHLLNLAAVLGRKRGWAAHAYRRRYGVWPRGVG